VGCQASAIAGTDRQPGLTLRARDAAVNQPPPERLERAELEQLTQTLLACVDEVARDLHAGRTHAGAADLDSSLERDLALDSLARVELGARIERTLRVTLDERAVFDAATPRELLRLVIKGHDGSPLSLSMAPVDNSAGTQQLPDQSHTLLDILDWHADRTPARTHIQFYDDYTDGAVLSYGELRAAAARAGAALQARGLEAGERVALMLPTDRAYFILFFAVLMAGAIPVPIYPPLRRQQLEDHFRRQGRILDSSGVAMLITTSETLTVARLATVRVDSLRSVVDAQTLLAADGEVERAHPTAADIGFLQYTSGSTGDPKGVVLSHTNLLANIRADGAGMGVVPGDVFVSWLPLYHDMGLIGAWLGSLYHAVKLVVMPPLSFLSRPERWLWAIHRYGGTLSAAPNFAYELCVNRIRDESLAGLDLSRWRVAANGAEAISVDTIERFCTRFGKHGFARGAMMPVYGLAECAVGLAFTPPGRGPLIERIERQTLLRQGQAVPARAGAADSDSLALVACGFPLPQHELRVVDKRGRELPERHEGRLQFRGPSATQGYFKNPEATAALFRGGWLETGDRGYIAAGELFITGREKDLIIRGGRNIYPVELEEAIGRLEGVRKGHVAVFGSMDRDGGTERVVAVVETRRHSPEARERLRQSVNALAASLIDLPPDEVVIVRPNTVLRTSSGKIRRQATRERYEQGRLESDSGSFAPALIRLALEGLPPSLRRGRRALASWIYAAWAWLVLILCGSLAWCMTWVPGAPRSAAFFARAALRLAGIPLRVEGLEHLPPENQGCVLVSNHQSYLDGIVLTALLPSGLRFLIKGELARSKLLAQALQRTGGFFVERFDAAAGLNDLVPVAQALAAGARVVVFPEGTFKRMPGLLPFHLGAFKLAVDAGVALVPLSLSGTRSILRADNWFPRRGAILLRIGPVCPPDDEEGWSAIVRRRDYARQHMLDSGGEPDLAYESNSVDTPTVPIDHS
jgi:1-acyl-sn-glycerol-3-phosphate acyltransferase